MRVVVYCCIIGCRSQSSTTGKAKAGLCRIVYRIISCSFAMVLYYYRFFYSLVTGLFNELRGHFHEQGLLSVLARWCIIPHTYHRPCCPNGGWFANFYKTSGFCPKTFGFMGQKLKPNGGEKEGEHKKDQGGDQQDPGEVARSRRAPHSGFQRPPRGRNRLRAYPGL